MQFADLKIRTRLAFAFGLVVLLSLASAGISLSKLAGVQGNLEDIVRDNNVKIRINNDLSESVHIVARVIRTVVLLEDKAAMEREAALVASARNDYAKNWETLQKFAASETVKANRAKIEQAANEARPLNTKVMELGLANKRAEATALLMKEAAPATAKWQDAIDENIKAQELQNEKQHEAAVADYEQARSLLIGASVLSIALAVLLGWLITRSIVRQLGAAADLEPPAVAPAALAARGGPQFATLRCRQHAEHRHPVLDQGDRDAPAGALAQKVAGAVDRVDHPQPPPLDPVGQVERLLGQPSRLRIERAQPLVEEGIDLEVDIADRMARRLVPAPVFGAATVRGDAAGFFGYPGDLLKHRRLSSLRPAASER